MDNNIKYLINNTTIVKVEDNRSKKIVFGDEYFLSRFQSDQGSQADLTKLEDGWNSKWKTFGNGWSEERQDFRYLYEQIKLFYYSFEQLRYNKVIGIYELDDTLKSIHSNWLVSLNLCGMYHHGKKCIDLLKKLKIINKDDLGFCNRFAETRNKFIEHNFNIRNLRITADPSYWSLKSTCSFMQINIHNSSEHVFDVYIDY